MNEIFHKTNLAIKCRMFLIFQERKRRGGNPLNHARSPKASKPVTIRRGLPLHPLTDSPSSVVSEPGYVSLYHTGPACSPPVILHSSKPPRVEGPFEISSSMKLPPFLASRPQSPPLPWGPSVSRVSQSIALYYILFVISFINLISPTSS